MSLVVVVVDFIVSIVLLIAAGVVGRCPRSVLDVPSLCTVNPSLLEMKLAALSLPVSV